MVYSVMLPSPESSGGPQPILIDRGDFVNSVGFAILEGTAPAVLPKVVRVCSESASPLTLCTRSMYAVPESNGSIRYGIVLITTLIHSPCILLAGLYLQMFQTLMLWMQIDVRPLTKVGSFGSLPGFGA